MFGGADDSGDSDGAQEFDNPFGQPLTPIIFPASAERGAKSVLN